MKSIRKMLVIIFMIIAAFTLTAAIMSVDAAEPRKTIKEEVYELHKTRGHTIMCIYGFAYFMQYDRMAPLFNPSNSKPMSCTAWKLNYAN